MTHYANVILPLPIYSSFTYAIPESLLGNIKIGSRVLVPFGKSGCHTGIIESVHTSAPAQGTVIKEIITLLDAEPILRNPQLKFWNWMAQYYLCSPGEVMKAALPAALKVESENWVEITQNPEPEEIETLNERQAQIYAYISHSGKTKIADAEKDAGISSARAIINTLIEKGLVQMVERVVDKYITRKVSIVSLTCPREDKNAIHTFMAAVSRSQAQEKLLLAYLDLSAWLNNDLTIRTVEKKSLLERTGVSAAVFNALIKKGIFKVENIRINRFSDVTSTSKLAPLPTLSDAQNKALSQIRKSMGANLVTLLRGVTGSGKTEIYSHLIEQSLAHGDHVLMLVPEISLTTQLTSRLRQFFGDRMLVYHSKFSDSERVDIWRKLMSEKAPMLILGVRSSIFLPFPRLGLLIVDEEHESSYKQIDPAPRYNARDAAIMLASMHGAKVLLGSATPAVDTYYKATTGKYGLVELLTRYTDVPLPHVDIVDMRDRRQKKMVTGAFSSDLLSATRNTLAEGKQAIIFQNRRGYAPVVVCTQCGWTPHCPHCDISLVLHKRDNTLKCHYCGFTMPLPSLCPACGGNTLNSFGYGTERLSDSLQSLIPDTSVARMDLDTTRAKDAYQTIIESFSRGETRILVGTQMVSKGLDFKNVKLVGIVNADTMTNFPDFRSNERAYCTFEQVAGRAGRHNQPGNVIIQTTNPEHPAITSVLHHDYLGFFNAELQQRKKFSYPPFSKIINISIKHKEEHTLDRLSKKYAEILQTYFGHRVLGPDTPSISRIAGMYIRTIMLKIEPEASMSKVKQLLHQIYSNAANITGMKTARLYYDVDPV